jgi:hypothetical protein
MIKYLFLFLTSWEKILGNLRNAQSAMAPALSKRRMEAAILAMTA